MRWVECDFLVDNDFFFVENEDFSGKNDDFQVEKCDFPVEIFLQWESMIFYT